MQNVFLRVQASSGNTCPYSSSALSLQEGQHGQPPLFEAAELWLMLYLYHNVYITLTTTIWYSYVVTDPL